MAERIICYGDIIDDIVVAPMVPIRSDTDTASVIRMRPGGSAANTAAWLGVLGADVMFVGVVGSGDAQRHAAALRGVDVRLREHPSLQTGRIVIIVQHERRDMLTDRGANVDLGPDDITDGDLEQARLLHITGHTLLNDAGRAGVRTLIERCQKAGVLVSVSPGSAGYIVDIGVDQVIHAFSGADLVFSGLDDGQLLTGETEPDAIVAALNCHFEIAVLTRGSQGVTVGERGAVFSRSIAPRPIVDPTGAGDAFCAGFLAVWTREGDVGVATQSALELAAEAVGVMGGRPDVLSAGVKPDWPVEER